MLDNPFRPVNRASSVLDQEFALLRRALPKGVLRAPAIDLSLDNAGASQQEPFYQSARVTPAVKNGLDTTLLNFDLEKGFIAVITGLAWNYNGAGFIDGSTGLFWRLLIDYRYWPQFSAVSQAFGTAETPRSIVKGIPIGPGQNVQVMFNIPAASPIAIGGTTQIFAAVSGVKSPLR